MAECLECARLREECALAFAEYLSCKDEFALIDKKAKEFTARRRGLERAEGRLRECHQEKPTIATSSMPGTGYLPKKKWF
jgi:hypothetical protein